MPKARSLASALDRSAAATRASSASRTRWRACKRAIAHGARKRGYDIRPTDHRTLHRARRARAAAASQPAALRALPLPRDPAGGHGVGQQRPRRRHARRSTPSRRARKPTHDPAVRQVPDAQSDTGDPRRACRYAYQSNCPNDAEPRRGHRPRASAPGTDPRPAAGRTGTASRTSARASAATCRSRAPASAPTTSIIDGRRRVESGNGGPSASARRTSASVVDRADGFVAAQRDRAPRRPSTTSTCSRPTATCFDRFKTFYAGEYGVLTFVEDHGLIENCEAAGNGDSGLYPARAPTRARGATRSSTRGALQPGDPHCDLAPQHRRLLRARRQRHPHRPQQLLRQRARLHDRRRSRRPATPASRSRRDLIERQQLLRQQLQLVRDGLRRRARHPGAGRHRPVDRRRQRQRRPRQPLLRQLAPRRDALRGARRDDLRPGRRPAHRCTGCDPAKTSTSYHNRFYGNIMGVDARRRHGARTASTSGGTTTRATPATAGATTTRRRGGDHQRAVVAARLRRRHGAGPSVGNGDGTNELELLTCFDVLQKNGYDPAGCPWFASPPEPGTAPAARQAQVRASALRRFAATPEAKQALCRVWHDRRPLRCGAF